MCINLCLDTCGQMCVDMNIDMCVDMCIDMCIDMRVSLEHSNVECVARCRVLHMLLKVEPTACMHMSDEHVYSMASRLAASCSPSSAMSNGPDASRRNASAGQSVSGAIGHGAAGPNVHRDATIKAGWLARHSHRPGDGPISSLGPVSMEKEQRAVVALSLRSRLQSC